MARPARPGQAGRWGDSRDLAEVAAPRPRRLPPAPPSPAPARHGRSPLLLAQLRPAGPASPRGAALPRTTPAPWRSRPGTGLRPGELISPLARGRARAQSFPFNSAPAGRAEREWERDEARLGSAGPSLLRNDDLAGLRAPRPTSRQSRPTLPMPRQLLFQGTAGPFTGQWPHLEAIRPRRSGGRGVGAPRSCALSEPLEPAAVRREPLPGRHPVISARPPGRPEGTGRDRMGRDRMVAVSQGLGLPPPQPGTPGAPCLPRPRGAEGRAQPEQGRDPASGTLLPFGG